MNADRPLGANRTPQLKFDGLKPNIDRGAEHYANQFAECHGEDGLGSDDGPPVWGDQSYNDEAVMIDTELRHGILCATRASGIRELVPRWPN